MKIAPSFSPHENRKRFPIAKIGVLIFVVIGVGFLVYAWLFSDGGFLKKEDMEKSAYDSGIETFARGEFDESIQFLEEVVKEEGENADAHIKLAVSYYNKKNYEQSIEHYKKAIEIQGESAQIYNGIANAYRDQKQYKDAEEFYKKAIEQDEKYTLAYSNWAVMHIDSGSPDRAKEILEMGIEKVPDSQEIKNILRVVSPE